jgi:hypothetical protein
MPSRTYSQSVTEATATQQSAADLLKATQQITADLLRTSTLAERYYWFQLIKNNPPNPGGISTLKTPLNRGPQSLQNLYAPAIKAATSADGTYQPFGAIFDILGSFGDAGSGSIPSAQSGIQTQGFGTITWESEHYGYENSTTSDNQVTYKSKFDFSFDGVIGLYPALVLENLTSTTTTIAQPTARPMFQDAFHWTIGPNLNHPLFSHGEATAFVNFGQNFLISEVTSYKQGDNTVTATPVSNGVGRAAGIIEGGLQVKMLASPIWIAHDNKTDNLTPLFLAAVGVRKDSRFRASGELAQYKGPEERLFFRFLLNLTKIGTFNDQVAPPKAASLRFGVDLERSIHDQRIPLTTRFYVTADLDIMKLFRPTAATPN